ncbi:hypothetical protein RU96_GL001928 [Enterococcus canintestini]|uniref:Uncharacterized protein n=1 Tax=Enterococcus canintestini TaxID=317010 RepID=A0A1L8R858_9ENTE|nr:hypothetical protein RU96_GL001928 [Enterococcus canintestini]
MNGVAASEKNKKTAEISSYEKKSAVDKEQNSSTNLSQNIAQLS